MFPNRQMRITLSPAVSFTDVRTAFRSVLLAGASAAAIISATSPAEAGDILRGNRMSSPVANVTAQQAASMQQAQKAARQASNSLSRATQAIQAMRAAQNAARDLALKAPSTVPNGLKAGGLVVAPGATPGSALWQGADAPTENEAGGRTEVGINQTQQKAILTWESFNVGRETTVDFDQKGNRNWVALNRVNDPSARPSQITGQIKADGSVYIINQSGVIFDGASQINVGALIASTAKISDEQFLDNGIYSAGSGASWTPSFTDAGALLGNGTGGGVVKVEAGSQIATHAPGEVTSGGGFVLLMGGEVENAGSIETPNGQAQLAAGDDFVLRPGYSTDGNFSSTTRGNEIAPVLQADSAAGLVRNSGVIVSPEGDITLAGRTVEQDGALVASTSVNARGTIHLLNSASDADGSVALGAGSVTAIVPELESDETALNSDRDGLILESEKADRDRNEAVTGPFDNLSLLSDRLDRSRIEIVTGGNVIFEGGETDGSLTIAQGGQVAVSAAGRVFTDNGAAVDVSGVRDVVLAMSANNLMVNIQGNELRDSPHNRESDYLKNEDVWVDIRDLIYMPDGAGGYDGERYYTPGGLLEVGGYLDNTAHTIGEWSAVGGTIALAAGEVIAQEGSLFDISGGSIRYESGYIRTSNFLGGDSRTYNINEARGDMTFYGLGSGFVRKHERWGVTDVWLSPLGRGRESVRWEEGYTVGRDAGSLVLSTPTVIMEADVRADVVTGERQMEARPEDVTDSYKLTQNIVAQAGHLVLGRHEALGFLSQIFDSDVRIADIEDIAGTLDPESELPEDREAAVWLDADRLNSYGLGGLELSTTKTASVESALELAYGGALTLRGAHVDINADITARSGSVYASNHIPGNVLDNTLEHAAMIDGGSHVALGEGVTLDLRGLWVNQVTEPQAVGLSAFIDGGAVTLESTHFVSVGEGSLIDVSSGAALLADRSLDGGRGGDVTLRTNFRVGNLRAVEEAAIAFDGDIRGYGAAGSGTLTIESGGAVSIGGDLIEKNGILGAGETTSAKLVLTEDVSLDAGEIIGFDYTFTRTTVGPGQSLDGVQRNVLNNGVTVTTQADWTVPRPTSGVFQIRGKAPDGTSLVRLVRSTDATDAVVPAGSELNVIYMPFEALPPGFVVPGDAFPDGIPIRPLDVTYQAGQVVPNDLTIEAGTLLPSGARFSRDVAVKPTLTLDAELFQAGFANYVVNGHQGLVVVDETRVDAQMPVYRQKEGVLGLSTGSDPADALGLWTPPLYVSDRAARMVTQRQGANLTLAAAREEPGAAGPLKIGKGAHIRVDPGASLTVQGGFQQIDIDGRLTAPGGSIDIINAATSGQSAPTETTLRVGDTAVLDVSGDVFVDTDFRGRRFGFVRGGGDITLGAKDPETFDGIYDVNGLPVVVEEGALIDLSGAAAVLDIHAGSQGAEVAGNGGTLSLASSNSIILDGSVDARAGGANAFGGMLEIMLESTFLQGDADPANPALRIVTIGEKGRARPDMTGPVNQYGKMYLGVDQIEEAGFDSLSIYARDAIRFEGDVSLQLGRSIRFEEGIIALSEETVDSTVRLTAPYIGFDGRSKTPTTLGEDGFFPGIIADYTATGSALTGSGSRFVAEADLIDFQDGAAIFGIGGERILAKIAGADQSESVDLPGFASIDLKSRGDMRFNDGGIVAERELTLTADRFYPTTHSTGVIQVGLGPAGRNGVPNEGAMLRFRSPGSGSVNLPHSVFGRLVISAPEIEQGGAIFAPLGRIEFTDEQDLSGTPLSSAMPFYVRNHDRAELRFLPGSITSVSANGLVLPYGYTIDGIDYFYDGDKVRYDYVGGLDTDQQDRTSGGLLFKATEFAAEAGAVIDVSGGGALQGAGFRSGRGGSVNVLGTPLGNANPSFGDPEGNEVYAIIPGYGADYAPVDPTLDSPEIGRQITIGENVPGLPAGTYTLLPAEYALMPGGYRVELGSATLRGLNNAAETSGVIHAAVAVGIANTGITQAVPREAMIMPGETVRQYSDFNETSVTEWVAAQMSRYGNPRLSAAFLPADVRSVTFDFSAVAKYGDLSRNAFVFEGDLRNRAAKGGLGGMVAFQNAPYEVISPGGAAHDDRLTLRDSDLNALKTPVLGIGTGPLGATGTLGGGSYDVVMRSGARLEAGAVILSGSGANGSGVVVESGASIDTRGRGSAGWGGENGFLLLPATDHGLLVVSNDTLVFGASEGEGKVTVAEGASLEADGTIALVGPAGLELGNIRLTANDLLLSVEDINIGNETALADASQADVLSNGWRLTQQILDGLLRPASGEGLKNLRLQATNSINFIGDVTLDTFDPATGESSAAMSFITPAIYGLGEGGDTAAIRTDRFIWSGLTYTEGPWYNPTYHPAEPGPVIPGGAGTGNGALRVEAREVLFGNDGTQRDPGANLELHRLALGFGDVEFSATSRITAEGTGSLSIYHQKNAADEYQGGNLKLTAPLLTGRSGSDMSYISGGQLTVLRGSGAEEADLSQTELGAQLSLEAEEVTVAGKIVAQSGRIDIHAENDLSIVSGAVLDLSGRAVPFFEQTRYSFGGTVTLESDTGSILQAAGSVIDVSADHADNGTVQAIAGQGQVDLAGMLLADGKGGGEAFEGGAVDVRAAEISGFAALNQRLNEGGFSHSRRFETNLGDLTIGEEVKAQHISVTANGGDLTVNGLVRAGGRYAGSMRLAAKDDLVLSAGAVLDASGDELRRDSDGGIIEGVNRAMIDLTSRDGRVVLSNGVTLDVSAGGEALGTVDINARRLGGKRGDDVAVDAGTGLAVTGAKRVAVNGFWRYDDADIDPEDADTQLVDQAYLDELHGDSQAFIDAALTNGALQTRLAGLKAAAGDAFQLRPGVEIVSADPDGNLRVADDIDLAGYRYGPDVVPGRRGSGTAGVFSLRAGGDLIVNGSISDGFDLPPETPDDSYSTEITGRLGADYILPEEMNMEAGWSIGSGYNTDYSLPFDLHPSSAFDIYASAGTFPVDVTLASTLGVANQTLEFGAVLPDGVVVTDISTGATYSGEIPPGTELALIPLPEGTVLRAGNHVWTRTKVTLSEIPAGTPLRGMSVTAAAEFSQSYTLPEGQVLPRNFTVSRLASAKPIENTIWAAAPMLDSGSESWSMRLVSGANLDSANARTVRQDDIGDLVLDDLHNVVIEDGMDSAHEGVSVIRTGTGDLELIAGRDYRQESRFGVYTAGTWIDNADTRPGGALNQPRATMSYTLPDGTLTQGVLGSAFSEYEDAIAGYQPWFTTGGGNLTIEAGRDIHGYKTTEEIGVNTVSNLEVGDWLWHQGAPELGQKSAWWINFGTYALRRAVTDSSYSPNRDGSRYLAAFDGIGTLGGGNVAVNAGRDLGAYETFGSFGWRGALTLAVGSTGWTDVDGTIHRTGGGNLTVNAGGQINPVLSSSADHFSGGFVNLRGDTDIKAGSIGTVWKTYEVTSSESTEDPRPDSYSMLINTERYGIANILPGDGTVSIRTRGDLAAKVMDPGLQSTSGVIGTEVDGEKGAVISWFTHFTGETSFSAFSAGGDVVAGGEDAPADFRAVAASGNLYGGSDLRSANAGDQAEFLAGGSIYRLEVTTSGAPGSVLATPENPAWQVLPEDQSYNPGTLLASNLDMEGHPRGGSRRYLDVYGRGRNTAVPGTEKLDPVLIYAPNGDMVYVTYGDVVRNPSTEKVTYISGRPAFVRAGRDIVRFGTPGGTNRNTGAFSQSRSLFAHSFEDDISLIEAGRDLIYVNAMISGPGTLEVTAGRNINQDNLGVLRSIGLVGAAAAGAATGGADIAVTLGAGTGGPDFDAIRDAYLDPANLADPELPLADQPGKAAKIYVEELAGWLEGRYGFTGTADEALAYFGALAPIQQRVFLRDMYYAELRAGGREYNDADGVRFGSYLRGRRMIETLWAGVDSVTGTSPYEGDLVMFSSGTQSGMIRTEFGGDVQILAPGGDVIVGVDAVRPENAHNGIMTQGTGDVQIYSQGDIALGLSRIMTTYGGDILAWSAAGDINAGRGAKTTVVYTPPRRIYDDYGNVVLSPSTPASGAGIATLAQIAGVAPGDVDLIAPLGTIDAGEAGIRVSGNLNIIAAEVVNVENIDVQGDVTGVPEAPQGITLSLDTDTAGQTASEVAKAATNSAKRDEMPSVVIVEVLGYGDSQPQNTQSDRGRGEPEEHSYNPDSAVQFVSVDDLTAEERAILEEERAAF
ncbi:filamentous hemagglutinin family protein [Tepidicaulis sp. LMO-SS28]|uniref:filamentous haemagglutinin family protein n=1 Tax=Tepidicaulis sp. LMO-SS28 TaxID=3447455 RepID=UPI003EE29A22